MRPTIDDLRIRIAECIHQAERALAIRTADDARDAATLLDRAVRDCRILASRYEHTHTGDTPEDCTHHRCRAAVDYAESERPCPCIHGHSDCADLPGYHCSDEAMTAAEAEHEAACVARDL